MWAASAMALMVIAGKALDVVSSNMWRTKMQSALDSAVLAGAATVREALAAVSRRMPPSRRAKPPPLANSSRIFRKNSPPIVKFSVEKNGVMIATDGVNDPAVPG